MDVPDTILMAMCFPTFGTKAETLERLGKKLQNAKIEKLFYFTVGEWKQDRKSLLHQTSKQLGSGPYIVRSSCNQEDTATDSKAGAFKSILNVKKVDLNAAINEVIESYGNKYDLDQVLIQPMLQNVCRSGVAFTHDPNCCAPYRLINWSEGEETSDITSGHNGFLWQQAALSPSKPPIEIEPVLKLLDELLAVYQNQPLDFEFAITSEKEHHVLWLLQVRPLVLSKNLVPEKKQTEHLSTIHERVSQGMTKHPFLLGSTTAYGVMPDWNPAEIIGIRPKPLALSLYQELITDSIWAYQRHNYGYRNLRSFPLMVNFYGLPYIDVRVSFNSFIPSDLEHDFASRLVDFYITSLLRKPSLHDKVEFEIVFSCYTLDLEQRLCELKKAGFSSKDLGLLQESLRKLTNSIIHPKNGLWRKDVAKLDILADRYDTITNSSLSPLDQVFWLIEDAKRYGTLPFAGLARVGFIAIQMLQSLVKLGVFTDADKEAFIKSVATVNKELAVDKIRLDKDLFLAKYGHLRPGTYEVCNFRYDEAPDLYFDWNKPTSNGEQMEIFRPDDVQMDSIETLLLKNGLQISVAEFLEFIKVGIEMREKAKFCFSKNLSLAISIIEKIGFDFDMNRNDIAFCDYSVFREAHASTRDFKNLLSKSIENGKENYVDTCSISLPPLISRPDDIWAFKWPEIEPNFITQCQIIGPIAISDDKDSLSGSIVCIPRADPGFDWLFDHKIVGLITKWGGANSHMAIRAGELGLPSAIGTGEILYQKVAKANLVKLDCAGRRVQVLS